MPEMEREMIREDSVVGVSGDLAGKGDTVALARVGFQYFIYRHSVETGEYSEVKSYVCLESAVRDYRMLTSVDLEYMLNDLN